MHIQSQTRSVSGWQAIVLQSNNIELAIVPAIGGRILSLRYKEIELLFTDKAHSDETFEITAATPLREMKQALGFRLWGGEKTWVAPQSAWWEAIPPLALDAGQYHCEQQNNTVILTSPICYETGLQIERQITLHTNDTITLKQILINRSDVSVTRGIWNVMQILQPAVCYFKAPLAAVKAFAAEGDSCALLASRVTQQDEWIRVDCTTPAHFKYGARVSEGVAKAVYTENGTQVTLCKSFAVDPAAEYAHDTVVEVYNSPNYPYCELEVHAPLMVLAPGERGSFSEEWRVGES